MRTVNEKARQAKKIEMMEKCFECYAEYGFHLPMASLLDKIKLYRRTAAIGLPKTVKIIADGGIKRPSDIIKALALGADGVLICRPFVNMIYGAREEGIQVFVNRLKEELIDTMEMCGANCLKEITRDMIR